MENVNETLLGGREIAVTKADGSKSTVKVKKISHLKGATLVAAYGDDADFAQLVTGLDEKGLEEFSEESFWDIVETGQEMNQQTLERALGSQEKKLGNPAYQKLFQRASSLTSSPGASPETPSAKPAQSSSS